MIDSYQVGWASRVSLVAVDQGSETREGVPWQAVGEARSHVANLLSRKFLWVSGHTNMLPGLRSE